MPSSTIPQPTHDLAATVVMPGPYGWMVRFGGTETLHLNQPNRPTDEEVALAIRVWKQGYEAGKHAGRAILQNDFRNLMGCQPR